MDPVSDVDAVTTSLGAYVLGALTPAERAAVDSHLGGCAACRDELSVLAGLPSLLGHLDATDVQNLEDGDPPLDGRLVERTLLELTRRRRVRQRRSRVLTAATVAAAAAAVVLVASPWSGGTPAVATRAVSASDPASGVRATLGLTPQPWGTALHLALRGVVPGTHCELVAVLTDGHRQLAGAWTATYEGTAEIDAVTDARPEQLAGVEVVSTRGVRLLSVPLRTP